MTRRSIRIAAAYLAAVAGPVAALILRLCTAVHFHQRPLLILFVMPILLAAYLGGLYPGLVATGLSLALTAYHLVPPAGSLFIAEPRDVLQWGILGATGLAISLLNEMLHRTRRQSEQAVSLELQLSAVAASVPGAIYSFQLDPDGHQWFPYANPQFEEMFGISCRDTARDAASLFARIHPEDIPAIQQSIAESAQRLAPWRGEFRIQHPSRGETWIEGRSIPQRLPNGGILWHGFAMDITERKRLEVAAREAEAFMQATIDSLDTQVCVLDRNGIILAVNRAGREFAADDPRLRRNAAVGDNYILLCERAEGSDAAEARTFADGIRAVIGGAQPSAEIRYRRSAREQDIWFLGRATLFAGQGRGIVVIAHHDITPLVHATEQQHEMEKILRHSPAIVWRWRAASGWPVEYVSENVRTLGYTPDDFTSGRIPYASIIHPEDVQRVGDEVKQYTAEGRKEFVQIYRLLTKSGEIRWMDDRTWISRDAHGQATHYQGIVLDITASRQAAEALERQVEELRRWQSVMIDREDRILALKREVNALHARLGEPAPYVAAMEPTRRPPA